ncbi:hypothetical protein SLS60_002311 [Paraconiothyrium brasiliense]|uniref:Carrier domain-containing protein n=1 Tax=Paraconiothyrium brasiliense TaxID=300254 RepID=A0ABR3S1S4_9PLEO
MQCVATYTRHNEEVVIHGTEATGKSCLRLEGLRLTELASVDQTSDEADRYGGARLHWVPDTRFQEPSSLVKIPTTSVHDRQVIEELALLCIVESVPLVKDLGPGKSHLSKHRAWLDWVAEEALSGQHPVLKDTIHVGDLSPKERQRRIHEIYMDASASSTMASFAEGIFRVYSNIQDLFTGRIDVLELLLHENTLAQIYDTVSFDYGRLVKAYSDQRPNLRILEVGAGTGGSTELILRAMQPIGQYSRYSRYAFTDISAGFFSTARERFATAPNMDFMVFDISHDPLEQGFVPDSYDLIIAANVVHATPSLSQTLHHLQLLLAPGGRLLLTEFCTSFRAPNFIYGNFSGWWLGEGDDREWEPYVSVTRWVKELKSVGLSGATDVILDSAEPWHYCATIISQKLEAAISPLMEVSILCKDHDALLTQRIVQGLEEEGYIPTIVTFGQELPANQDILVSLDLETRFFRDLREQDLRHFQVLCRQLKKQNLLWLMPPFQVDCLDPHGSQSLGMIRTVRSELDLSITTLEINPDATNLVPHVLRLLRETRKATSNQGLFPDHEYVVHDNQIQISRYHPFSLEQELGQEPALNFDGNATYLLTGGLGGLGRLISVWLVEHGARQLVFLSPNAGKKSQDKQLFAELESMGCEVVAVQGVAQSETDISRAIAAAASPVKGVVHLSMQLRDGPILEMTRENWNAVVSPKVDGAWNLHRQLPDLDFFVMTSSLGTVFQQPGQSNYNAANTFLESFCRYRHSLGLPASVLNICPIEDVGYVAENSEARQKLRSQGHWFLDEAAFLKFLELGIRHSNPSQRVSGESHDVESGVIDSQIIMGLKSETPLDDPSNHATWRFDRRMGLYHNIVPEANSQHAAARDDIRTFVARASDNPSLLNEASSKEYLASEIGKKIFSFIMKAEEDLDVSLSLAQVRLDSLMAIELRRWYKQVFGVEINVLEILSSGTIAGLGEVAAKALQRKFREGER